ncbi:MAG: putative DNA ligase [Microgenomates group bacterium GW2011_GWA1_Microgenomates_45_10]|nr:MAG: putative DNA ligase [Microgenomates group bacterium GW2011_GWA2_44_7]KKT77344.1 MAG: putative DNA ligase [Microgenomates group bacterium GW2011_GWB1_44_8]KKT87109.1 MAG: putative DNA ligase [Microgenomates group bacterium GW2011_GWA1_Microgenomates_45_10]
MKFSHFCQVLSQLEQTSSRNQMVVILSGLFKNLRPEETAETIYLLQGRVAPLYEPIEFGLSDKLLVRAISKAYEVENSAVVHQQQKLGDLGKATETIASQRGKNVKSDQSVFQVHARLFAIAKTSGLGSVDKKINLVGDLLSLLDPLSVRFVIRIVLDTLRLGFSDMTMIEAFSWSIDNSKAHKLIIESAYNIRPDLGQIATILKKDGISGLRRLQPSVNTPILMARGERLTSGEDIINKIGRCALEHKVDGFRLQIHFSKKRDTVRLFTRNLEDATVMYPDVVEGIKQQINAAEAIFEGEAVGYNEKSGQFLPFQETVQRKRKYHIEEKALEIPLKLICFDVLYKDGQTLLSRPYGERRKILEDMVKSGPVLSVIEEKVVETPEEVKVFFQDAVTRGLEGIFAKRLDGAYQAGARGWNWIKYKRSYAGRLEDTLDTVIMGYDYGTGKRTSFGIGALLLGVYNPKKDRFETISKMGTGLTDIEWKEMRQKLDLLKVSEKPARYEVDKAQTVDIWVNPKIVIQVRADEITRSPVHTAGKDNQQLGYALRFPRLETIRDKIPEDASSVAEVISIYKAQGKQKV